MEIKDYKENGREIYNKLRLLTYPVAIKFIKNLSEIPEKVQRPSEMGQKLSLCQAFTMARRWGATIAMTYEDNFCVTSSFVHQWKKMPVKYIIESQVKSGYHKDLNAELAVQSVFAEFTNKKSYEKIKDHIGFVVSPITRTKLEPDVILLYGDPAQITHIIQALSYEGKYVIKSSFIGFGESCLKGVLLPYISNKPQVVLPGTGDRTLALTKEEEMAIGFPGKLLSYINDNLFKSGGIFNMRQPSRFVLGQPPLGPPAWDFLERKLRKYEREKKKQEENSKNDK
ncbi:MAG: hypothetical protein EU551_01080 [Promethearchaeota archaeon]|nr:MAG: hypothetical protein EU551_01080 [Candidatus Lokiarchaeota archaeon]